MKHKIKRKWVQSDNAEGGGGDTQKEHLLFPWTSRTDTR